MTAALPNDTVTGSETEAAAARFVFSREEGLEEPRFHFVAHSAAVVAQRDRDLFSGGKLRPTGQRVRGRPTFEGSNLDRETTAFGHRVAGVDRQIYNESPARTGRHRP